VSLGSEGKTANRNFAGRKGNRVRTGLPEKGEDWYCRENHDVRKEVASRSPRKRKGKKDALHTVMAGGEKGISSSGKKKKLDYYLRKMSLIGEGKNTVSLEK